MTNSLLLKWLFIVIFPVRTVISILIWLVVGQTPLQNMKVSWDDDIPNWMEKNIYVPNHQPGFDWSIQFDEPLFWIMFGRFDEYPHRQSSVIVHRNEYSMVQLSASRFQTQVIQLVSTNRIFCIKCHLSLTWTVRPSGNYFPTMNHDSREDVTVRSWWHLPIQCPNARTNKSWI